VDDLALQVGAVNHIVIHEADMPDPGCCQIQGDR
jgi:hypothetical protein